MKGGFHMYKKVKPSIGKYYKLPNPGLWAFLKHNVQGQPEDYRPPFWNKMDRQSVLKLWDAECDRLGFSEKFPDLWKFEQDMRSKVGPMSIQLPLDQRLTDIENYYTMIENDGVPISKEAIEATKRYFSPVKGIRLKSRPNVLAEMKLSTNSGSWLFTKRRKVARETLKSELYVHDKHLYARTSDNEVYQIAGTLGWRGQEGGIEPDDVKQRVVIMASFLLNLYEGQFYQPFIEACQKQKLIPGWVSMNLVDQEITALFDTKGSNDLVICTDFSKFDQHWNQHLKDATYEVISYLCDDAFDKEFYYARFNTPIVCSEDIMFEGTTGMQSGLNGTNPDENVGHKSLQFECALNDHATLNPHSMAYGDDGVLTFKGISVEKVIQSYTSHGLEMNATKQYVSTHDCVFLRRWHGTDYRVNGIMVGVYSTYRALGRLLAQERFYDPDKWNERMVVLRALSILENCKWHPYFHQFIDFVMKGDKLKLGLAIPGFFDELPKLAEEAIESFPDFLGYTKSMQDRNPARGIADWEVVKYLRSKA
jgi:hypothetical protein